MDLLSYQQLYKLIESIHNAGVSSKIMEEMRRKQLCKKSKSEKPTRKIEDKKECLKKKLGVYQRSYNTMGMHIQLGEKKKGGISISWEATVNIRKIIGGEFCCNFRRLMVVEETRSRQSFCYLATKVESLRWSQLVVVVQARMKQSSRRLD